MRMLRQAPLLWLTALLLSCGSSSDSKNEDVSGSSESQEESDNQPATTATTATTNPAALAMDPKLIPLDALAEFDEIELDANPPCSETIETIRPIFAEISMTHTKLATAKNNATAVQLLGLLSTTLTQQSKQITLRNESNELRRTSNELAASIADLAESLKLAGDALTAHDKQAAANTMRRIHNGVDNIRTSLEGLIRQCAQ